MPLWAQLESELRRRLADGAYDDRFPTDRELMEVYGVSRHTARHAIGLLGSAGIVKRARGVGTSLDRSTLTRSLGWLYSVRQVAEDNDVPETCEVLTQELLVDADIAAQLGASADTQLMYVHRLRRFHDEPVALDEVWIRCDLADGLQNGDFSEQSLYDEFERTIGRRPNAGRERITAVSPTAAERQLLELDNQALWCFERIGRFDTEAVELRRTVFRGDRLAMIEDWNAGQRLDPRLEVLPPGS